MSKKKRKPKKQRPRRPFELGKFPYIYKCPKCKDEQLYPKEKYELMCQTMQITSQNPVFFECGFCPGELMKPKGYHGESGYDFWLYR